MFTNHTCGSVNLTDLQITHVAKPNKEGARVSDAHESGTWHTGTQRRDRKDHQPSARGSRLREADEQAHLNTL